MRESCEETAQGPVNGKVPLGHEKMEKGWHVVGAVDAENSFGATIRTDYSCRVVKDDNDDWILRDVSLGNR